LFGGSATANPNASDALSGVASSSCDPIDTSAPGPQSVACAATDKAGNTANASASYVVDFKVIHVAPPAQTTFQPGPKLPVKFQLAGANGAAINDAVAQSLASCAATVTYPGRAATCASYSTVDHFFHASVPTPAGARLGVPVSLAIHVTVDNTQVASASLAVDPAPGLQVTDTLIHTPTSGAAKVGIRITLSGPSAQIVTFRWATAQGSAKPPDYVGTSGSGIIPAGKSSTLVYVLVRSNPHAGPNKTFYVFAWAPQHAIVTRPIGTQIIGGHH
jgi:hypothetical protein